jgi:membrane-associated phospholipid phosphatase
MAQSTNQSQLPTLQKSGLTWLARVISRVASPPFLSTIIMLVTAIALKSPAAWFWCLEAIFVNILLPTLYIFILSRKGRVTDFDVYLRQQRSKPYIFSLACMGLSLILMFIFRAQVLIILISVISVVQTLLLFGINHYWKISAHVATSSAFAVIFWMLMGIWGLWMFFLVPLVAWSRIRMQRHTLAQTIGGGLLGFGMFFVPLALFFNIL